MKVVLCLLVVSLRLGASLDCFSCQQSYRTPTFCSTILPDRMVEQCEGNQECVQAVEFFQNGSLQLVRRACSPPGFCDNYQKNGELKQCKTCRSDRCNNDILYDPMPTECS